MTEKMCEWRSGDGKVCLLPAGHNKQGIHCVWTNPREEIVRLREANQKLNRRATAAEGQVKTTIDDCRRAGVSLGRALANAGYEAIVEERDALRRQLLIFETAVGNQGPSAAENWRRTCAAYAKEKAFWLGRVEMLEKLLVEAEPLIPCDAPLRQYKNDDVKNRIRRALEVKDMFPKCPSVTEGDNVNLCYCDQPTCRAMMCVMCYSNLIVVDAGLWCSNNACRHSDWDQSVRFGSDGLATNPEEAEQKRRLRKGV